VSRGRLAAARRRKVTLNGLQILRIHSEFCKLGGVECCPSPPPTKLPGISNAPCPPYPPICLVSGRWLRIATALSLSLFLGG